MSVDVLWLQVGGVDGVRVHGHCLIGLSHFHHPLVLVLLRWELLLLLLSLLVDVLHYLVAAAVFLRLPGGVLLHLESAFEAFGGYLVSNKMVEDTISWLRLLVREYMIGDYHSGARHLFASLIGSAEWALARDVSSEDFLEASQAAALRTSCAEAVFLYLPVAAQALLYLLDLLDLSFSEGVSWLRLWSISVVE